MFQCFSFLPPAPCSPTRHMVAFPVCRCSPTTWPMSPGFPISMTPSRDIAVSISRC